MTVEENLEVAQYSIQPLIRAALASDERAALLERTGLAGFAGLPAHALPLLRRKRLEVARALALKPRIVLLDEVGAGLVDSEITELIGLIRSIADPRVAIVIVEHVLRVVRECCARSMVLNFGRKLIEGPTSDIFANDEVAAVYLGTARVREASAAGKLVREVGGHGPDHDPSQVSFPGLVDVMGPAAERRVVSPLIAPPSVGTAAAVPLLELKGICAGYGQARVLKGVDLTVQQGEAIAILGANGAGKTTLARTICGALAPTSGLLRIRGETVAGLAPHRIAALGIAHCMEGRRIFPTLSVQENLLIAARDADASSARQRLAAVYDLFPILAERKDEGGTSMSGGQQQMLAIGRALMSRPRLVIFDEISLGLAPVVMDTLYEALEVLKQAGMTLVIIEQDVDRALAIADHACVLEHGVFSLSGPASHIASDPRLRHIYIGAGD